MRPCLAALLILAAAPLPARAHPGPMCGSPEVLDVVANILAARGVTAGIAPGWVGEVPAGSPQTVLCAVRLVGRYYDTNRFGLQPQPWAGRFEYFVRQGRNARFVEAAAP